MFAKSEKIFTVYEKPESPEPTDRVVMLREGFIFWAFALNLLWLLANRMWAVAAGYFAVSVLFAVAAELLHLSEISVTLLQLWLQVMLGFAANDLQGWWLQRRGYRFAGVIAAESPMYAQRRYDEFAA